MYVVLKSEQLNYRESVTRVFILTGISEPTIKRIIYAGKTIDHTEKKRNTAKMRLMDIDEALKKVVRQKVYNLYRAKQAVTLATIQEKLEEESVDFPYKDTCNRTLSRLLRELGFRFRKLDKRSFAFEELESEPAEVTSSEEPFLPQFNNFDMDTFLECDKNSSVFQEFNAEEVFKMVLEDQSKNESMEIHDENVFSASTSAPVTDENDNTQEEVIHLKNTEAANSSISKHTQTALAFRAPKSRKRKITGNENISTISAVIDKPDEVVQNNKNQVDDEFDVFDKYIAVQLKQMLLYDSIICQEQIESIIRQKRLHFLMTQSQYHTTPSSIFPPEYHSSLLPALPTDKEGESWSSSITNQFCDKQQCGEDSRESSDMFTAAVTSILS
ncbi:hypothetical protein RN001_012266 [Aquatica leii]|uniref:Uncharacterized protein n=1 Tax=Aquatica leii TaxID=1421715 RepID=A0AAN7P2S7_9COLE|nr:hypothetical protein RN001_012266 [Aquatica leii]